MYVLLTKNLYTLECWFVPHHKLDTESLAGTTISLSILSITYYIKVIYINQRSYEQSAKLVV